MQIINVLHNATYILFLFTKWTNNKKKYIIIYVLVAISVFTNRNKLLWYMHTDVCDEKIISKAKRILGKNNSDETVSKTLGN